ncbi:MAG: DNA polymerase III subunit chi [Polaromonas sp.]|nr:MAG: DNA polymerase III subunit chi [Polaromonas sp.]
MTDIAFHFGVADKLAYSCRLLRKAYQSGAQLVVIGASDTLAALDHMLWTFSTSDFVPHYRPPANTKSATTLGKALEATPVLLVESVGSSTYHGILVNLGSDVPDGFECFERLIEVVSTQDADRLAARRRWRHYADRGYTLQRHDLAAVGEHT